MDFRLYWIIGGIVLLILELFVGTFDFLALGIAALITGILAWVFGIDVSSWEITGAIFLVAAAITLAIMKFVLLPKFKKNEAPEPMSGESIIGVTLPLEKVNNKLVVRYEGVYRNLDSTDGLSAGDDVKITAMHNNRLAVEKV